MSLIDSIKSFFGISKVSSEPVRAINYPYQPFGVPAGGEFYLDASTVETYIDSAIRAYVSVPEFAAAVETLKADIISEGWTLQGDPKRVEYITETMLKLNFNQILETFVTDLLVTSNAYLEFRPVPTEVFDEFVKMEKGRRPSKAFTLWNLPPHRMKVITDVHGKVVEYVQNYGSGDAEVHFKPDEVIHLTINKPASLPYGIPYSAALDQDLALLEYAKNYAKKFFKNSAIPDLVVLYKGKGVVPEKNWKAIQALFESLKGVTNAHRTLLLQGEFEFTKLNEFKKDMEFLELINRARENIWSVYGTPADRILGVKDRDLNSYYAKVNYLQKIIESFLNSKVFQMFGVRFVMNRTYKVDELRVTQKYVMLVQNGILTPDEARKELGYEPGFGRDLHPNELGNVQLPERDIASARPRGGDGISDSPQDRGSNLDNIPEKGWKKINIIDSRELEGVASVDDMDLVQPQSVPNIDVPVDENARTPEPAGPYYLVDFTTFVLLVERTGEFWKANVLYYEDDEKYVLYWHDGSGAAYKTVVVKDSLEDEEWFRFEYLRNATRVFNEV